MPIRNISIMLKVLRAQLKSGTDALERGDFIEVDDADLERYLERLTTPAPKRAREAVLLVIQPRAHDPGVGVALQGAHGASARNLTETSGKLKFGASRAHRQ